MHIERCDFGACQNLRRNHVAIVKRENVIRGKRLELWNKPNQFICTWCDEGNIVFFAELGYATKPNIFIGIILMGDDKVNLNAGFEQFF